MKKEPKKIRIYSEIVYFAALLIISLSVAMIAAADYGVSMIVAPAYIISLKFDFLTFGQAEYVFQGILFILFCIVIKKFRAVFLTSFVTCIIYGAMLDMWRAVIPAFNPQVTTPGDFSVPVRIAMLLIGMLMTSFSVCLFYRTYLYPQVYDFFVKGVAERYSLNRTKFKILFDCCCLALAAALTLLFFKAIRGIGFGTLLMTALNGLLIGAFGKMTDKFFIITPAAQKFSAHFGV